MHLFNPCLWAHNKSYLSKDFFRRKRRTDFPACSSSSAVNAPRRRRIVSYVVDYASHFVSVLKLSYEPRARTVRRGLTAESVLIQRRESGAFRRPTALACEGILPRHRISSLLIPTRSGSIPRSGSLDFSRAGAAGRDESDKVTHTTPACQSDGLASPYCAIVRARRLVPLPAAGVVIVQLVGCALGAQMRGGTEFGLGTSARRSARVQLEAQHRGGPAVLSPALDRQNIQVTRRGGVPFGVPEPVHLGEFYLSSVFCEALHSYPAKADENEDDVCVVFVGGKAVPADRDFPGCNWAAGKSRSETEGAGTANPVRKGNDGSDEGAPKPPRAWTKTKRAVEGPARRLTLPELAPRQTYARGGDLLPGVERSTCGALDGTDEGNRAVPADRDFPGCNWAAGKSRSETEGAGTANPVRKGNDGSDEGAPKPPKGAKLKGPKARARAREAGPRAPTHSKRRKRRNVLIQDTSVDKRCNELRERKGRRVNRMSMSTSKLSNASVPNPRDGEGEMRGQRHEEGEQAAQAPHPKPGCAEQLGTRVKECEGTSMRQQQYARTQIRVEQDGAESTDFHSELEEERERRGERITISLRTDDTDKVAMPSCRSSSTGGVPPSTTSSQVVIPQWSRPQAVKCSVPDDDNQAPRGAGVDVNVRSNPRPAMFERRVEVTDAVTKQSAYGDVRDETGAMPSTRRLPRGQEPHQSEMEAVSRESRVSRVLVKEVLKRKAPYRRRQPPHLEVQKTQRRRSSNDLNEGARPTNDVREARRGRRRRARHSADAPWRNARGIVTETNSLSSCTSNGLCAGPSKSGDLDGRGVPQNNAAPGAQKAERYRWTRRLRERKLTMDEAPMHARRVHTYTSPGGWSSVIDGLQPRGLQARRRTRGNETRTKNEAPAYHDDNGAPAKHGSGYGPSNPQFCRRERDRRRTGASCPSTNFEGTVARGSEGHMRMPTDEVAAYSSNYGSREYESANGSRKMLNDVVDMDKAAAQAPTANGRERRRTRKRKGRRHMKHATVTRVARRVRYDSGCGARKQRNDILEADDSCSGKLLVDEKCGRTQKGQNGTSRERDEDEDEGHPHVTVTTGNAPKRTRPRARRERNNIAGRGSRTSELPMDEGAGAHEGRAGERLGARRKRNDIAGAPARTRGERESGYGARKERNDITGRDSCASELPVGKGAGAQGEGARWHDRSLLQRRRRALGTATTPEHCTGHGTRMKGSAPALQERGARDRGALRVTAGERPMQRVKVDAKRSQRCDLHGDKCTARPGMKCEAARKGDVPPRGKEASVVRIDRGTAPKGPDGRVPSGQTWMRDRNVDARRVWPIDASSSPTGGDALESGEAWNETGGRDRQRSLEDEVDDEESLSPSTRRGERTEPSVAVPARRLTLPELASAETGMLLLQERKGLISSTEVVEVAFGAVAGWDALGGLTWLLFSRIGHRYYLWHDFVNEFV
ncbi:hypothetical protein C8R46DRAFT_1037639 [Mycena filopes]|nr:hypothetical protein C8R46DRAFT_1037639 [Mycena filopes]